MAHIISLSVSDGSSVSKHFEPEIDGRLGARIRISCDLTEQEVAAVPRTLRIGQPDCGCVPDVIGWNTGGYVLSPRLRDLIEELEPGRHRYIPIEIVSDASIGGKTEHGTHFLLLAPAKIDALEVDETEFWFGFGREGFEQGEGRKGGGGISPNPTDVCVVRQSAVAGHHIYRLETHSQFGIKYMCSDTFWQRYMSLKLRGWQSDKKCQEK